METMVVTSDSEIGYHITIIYYDKRIEYYFVDFKVVDKFLKELKNVF